MVCPFGFFQHSGIVCDDFSNRLTFSQSWAVAACRHIFFQCTLMNTAKTTAEYSFNPLNAAALTVDMFRQSGNIIQLGLWFCRFFTQCLIVIECCKICVVLFAVQPAVCDRIPHSYAPPGVPACLVTAPVPSVAFLDIYSGDRGLTGGPGNKILRRRYQHHKSLSAVSSLVALRIFLFHRDMLYLTDNH